MVRYDMAYATVFNCNWKLIRYDYPNLHRWLRSLYWEVGDEAKGAFKDTTHFDIVSELYESRLSHAEIRRLRNNKRRSDSCSSSWKGMRRPQQGGNLYLGDHKCRFSP